MTIFNQGWITLGGEPVTGRAPTQVLFHVAPGVEASPQQRGAVAHAYKLFCDAVKNSAFPSGFHVQRRKFPDGMRVQMTSNLGRHEVQVWITGGASAAVYRGFVIKPLIKDGAALVWSGFTTLLRYAGAQWRRWVSGYSPGGETDLPTFFVSSESKQKRTIQSDAKYNDVVVLHRGGLYKNGERAGSFTGATGRPIVVAPEVFALTPDGTIYRRAGASAALLFSWVPNILTPGTRHSPEARFANRSTEPQVQLLTYNLTAAGALQTFRQTVKLLTAAPWFSTTGEVFAQLGVAAALRSTSGWTSTSSEFPLAPMISPIHSDHAAVYWIYPYSITPGPVGTVFSVNPEPDAPQTVQTYVKSLSGSDPSVRLYPDIEGHIAREVSVAVSRKEGNVPWWNTNSSPKIWTSSVNPSQLDLGGGYWARTVPPVDISHPPVYTGDRINIGLREIGGMLTETDTASSRTTLDVIGAIYTSDTTHSITHREVTSTEFRPAEPFSSTGGPFGYNNFPPPGGGDTFWVPVRQVTHTDPWPATTRVRRSERLDVSGTAKDYVFADTENGVYVYFESTISGTRTQEYSREDTTIVSSDVGEITFIVELVLQSSSFGTFRGTKKTFALNSPVTAPFVTAEDIAPEPTFLWQYVSPERVPPIFSPRGFGQGACAEIAYTTTEEAPTKRLLASFREQVLVSARPSFYPVPAIIEAHQTKIPMGETLLAAHFPGLYFGAILSIETEPFVLNASYPGVDVHGDIGITGTAPHSKVYRT